MINDKIKNQFENNDLKFCKTFMNDSKEWFYSVSFKDTIVELGFIDMSGQKLEITNTKHYLSLNQLNQIKNKMESIKVGNHD